MHDGNASLHRESVERAAKKRRLEEEAGHLTIDGETFCDAMLVFPG